MKFLWLSGFLLFSLTAVATCPSELRMAYNNNWLPYVRLTDETVTGTDIELVRSLTDQLGIRLRLQQMSEQRALQQLQQGELDLLFAASYTKDRADYAYFSVPYREENITAVLDKHLLAQFPDLNSKAGFYQLAAKRWSGAVNTAGYYGEEFEHFKQNEGQNRLFHVTEELRRLQMVAQGRAQYSIVDPKVARYHISQHKELSELQLLPFVLHRSDIHLMYSKKTVSVLCVRQLDQLLTQLLSQQTASAL
jgi:polar amino acid transport system substrate-binding protein